MFAAFKILTGDRAPSLSVAANAIVQEGDKQVVFVEKSATEFMRRVVRTGMTQGNTVQILDGLQSGDRVVNQGAIFLSNASGN